MMYFVAFIDSTIDSPVGPQRTMKFSNFGPRPKMFAHPCSKYSVNLQ